MVRKKGRENRPFFMGEIPSRRNGKNCCRKKTSLSTRETSANTYKQIR
ncbi:hypothetical protein NB636_05695 [Oxalobacter aliiformigenes]|nr:hypothetical protein [Oxalobacter aliiformigenes]MCZ4065209.1 hypothetical protein [Oxalobacter aliiformigenes]WAV98246.1 hypothetical protein NB636_05695 [Oxalobacter aliiformigenes]